MPGRGLRYQWIIRTRLSLRNSIVNVGETVVYDAVKDGLLSSGRLSDGVPLHLTSALVAGLSATLVASPVDVIKTRFRLLMTRDIFSDGPVPGT